MTRPPLEVIAALALMDGMVGCGGSDDNNKPPASSESNLCRASGDKQRMRLFFRMSATGDDGVGVLNNQNGLSYLVIDDACRYFAYAVPDGADYVGWQELRTGTLTRAEATSISETVRYGAWQGLDGDYRPADTVDHPVAFTWSDGTTVIGCLQSCRGGNTPAEFRRIRDGTMEFLASIWKDGQRDLYAPVRARILRGEHFFYDPAVYPPPIAWPGHAPLDAVMMPDTGYPGGAPGLLLEDPEGVAKLREIAGPFQRGLVRSWRAQGAFIPFRRRESPEGQFDAAGYLRDVCPFENDVGRIPLAW